MRALYGSARGGTAGGAGLRVKTASTAGSGGTANGVRPRHPGNPAAGVTITNDGSAFVAGSGTVSQRLSVGMAQTGGNGGWVAIEPAAGIQLKPNGGANGNLEIWSIANGVSVAADISAEIAEGQ